MPRRRLFTVVTPLGYRVVLTRNRWREIVRFKHPAVAGRESEVRDCLREPHAVRASVHDADVHLYYRARQKMYLCVVVAPTEGEDRFVVSAYLTKTLKKGQLLWTA